MPPFSSDPIDPPSSRRSRDWATLLLYPFLGLAACGFTLSLSAHISTFAGGDGVYAEGLRWLQTGIFVVWTPAVLAIHPTLRNTAREDYWKVALMGCPVWMRWTVLAVGLYATLSFLWFLASTGRLATQAPDGSPLPAGWRAMSGHWMIFYSIAFALLYSRIFGAQLYRDRRMRR